MVDLLPGLEEQKVDSKGIFRSEDMQLYKVVMSKDNEYKVASLLGQLGCAHFIDMNEAEQVFNQAYVDRVKHCEEADRKLT